MREFCAANTRCCTTTADVSQTPPPPFPLCTTKARTLLDTMAQALTFKTSSKVDMKTPFMKYLYAEANKNKGLFASIFGGGKDAGATKHEAALDDFDSMRETARAAVEPSVTARDVLLRYFYQVGYRKQHILQPLFVLVSLYD